MKKLILLLMTIAIWSCAQDDDLCECVDVYHLRGEPYPSIRVDTVLVENAWPIYCNPAGSKEYKGLPLLDVSNNALRIMKKKRCN